MEPYHYIESGLNNVYLEDGFRFHDTPYGKGVTIEDTEGLHQAIGLWLIETPKRLIGAELRFLRLEMDLTQRCLGELLGGAEQQIQRWERARENQIPGSADRLIRALYGECVHGDGSVRRMVERLASLDEVPHPTVVLGHAAMNRWRVDFGADEPRRTPVAANDLMPLCQAN